MSQLLEPPRRQPREDGALVGDRLVEHDVEGGEPIGRHQQRVRVVHLVGRANLAAMDERQPFEVGGQRGHGRSSLFPSGPSPVSVYPSGGRLSRRRAKSSMRSKTMRITTISAVATREMIHMPAPAAIPMAATDH